MSEERENKAIWDEVLGKVNLPPRSDSWKAMEQILDREMPNRSNRRRWLWLLLLLLLIGVCNYHRFLSQGPDLATKMTTTAAKTSSGGQAASAGAGGQFTPAGAGGQATPAGTGARATETAPGAVTGSGNRAGSSVSLANFGVKPGHETGYPGNDSGTGATNAGTTNAGTTNAGTTNADTTAAGTTNAGTKSAGTPKADTAKSAPARPDTTSKKGAPAKAGTPNKPNKDKYRGFAVAIGFNQFFPLGQQVTSDVNSSGTDGQLSDYLPIPQVRYYFNKKLYVQVEAQFNTPQYTSKNLALKNSVLTTDTLYMNNANTGALQSYPVQTDSSAYIRKLYYFNVPVSIHYSPLKNVWVGTGLQYAKLTNGVALYQNSRLANAVVADSLELSKLETLKGSTLYSELKSHEFRLLFDANYQWKGFMFGLRYNQALSKFIDLKLGPSTVVQARNSSLQLYIRYTIWQQRSLKNKK